MDDIQIFEKTFCLFGVGKMTEKVKKNEIEKNFCKVARYGAAEPEMEMEFLETTELK